TAAELPSANGTRKQAGRSGRCTPRGRASTSNSNRSPRTCTEPPGIIERDMDALESQVDFNDDEHKANRAAMDATMSEFRARLSKVHEGGGPELVAKHKGRGKLL